MNSTRVRRLAHPSNKSTNQGRPQETFFPPRSRICRSVDRRSLREFSDQWAGLSCAEFNQGVGPAEIGKPPSVSRRSGWSSRGRTARDEQEGRRYIGVPIVYEVRTYPGPRNTLCLMRAFLAAPLLGVGDSPKNVFLLLASHPSNKSTNQGRPQEPQGCGPWQFSDQ